MALFLDLDWLEEKNQQAIKHWGLEKEKWVIVEEMGELSKAMSKFERGLGPKEDILEEAADVLIMATSAATSYGFSQEELYMAVKEKIKRLEGYFAEDAQ